MDATMTQIPNNTSVIDTASMSSVGISSTETPPPGYMSEDGDPMDQNDNLSEFIVGDRTMFKKFKFKNNFNDLFILT